MAGRELPGIAQQVLQYGADEDGVSQGPDWLLDNEADPTIGVFSLKFTGHAGYVSAEVDRLEVNLSTGDTESCNRSSISIAICSLAISIRSA